MGNLFWSQERKTEIVSWPFYCTDASSCPRTADTKAPGDEWVMVDEKALDAAQPANEAAQHPEESKATLKQDETTDTSGMIGNQTVAVFSAVVFSSGRGLFWVRTSDANVI